MNYENVCVGRALPTTQIDNTANGECSNCGGCCSNVIPISNKEIKAIRAYIKKHDIKAYNNLPSVRSADLVDMMCPFRDNEKKICTIYEKRPLVCRLYKCNYTRESVVNAAKVMDSKKYVPRDMRAIFLTKYSLMACFRCFK